MGLHYFVGEETSCEGPLVLKFLAVTVHIIDVEHV